MHGARRGFNPSLRHASFASNFLDFIMVGRCRRLVEAVQVYVGLTLANKVGAGLFVGFTVNAARIPSLLIDHFGRLRMQPHPSSFRPLLA
jgi:hypothetical protein